MIEFTRPPTGGPQVSKKVSINPGKVTTIYPSATGTFIAFDVLDLGVLVGQSYDDVLNKFRRAEAGKAQQQLDRLRDFIVAEMPGGLIDDEGPADCAIRMLGAVLLFSEDDLVADEIHEAETGGGG